MSDTKTRKVHSAGFKAKVALEAVRETKTLNEIGQEYGVHPVQVSHWKKRSWRRPASCLRGSVARLRSVSRVTLSGFIVKSVGSKSNWTG